MRSMLRLLSAMTKWERILLVFFSISLFLSFGFLLRRFYIDSTVELPSIGGTYIEGSVGEIHFLNPWFTVANDVNRDIVSLVFAGLLRYDPKSQKITEDLATMSVSDDRKIYTLKLKEGIVWHDSTSAAPHPVTADDVMFTFQSIQDPAFPNPLLRQNFRGVTIEKIDDRTVRFRLAEPYTYFVSNLTLGIVPKKSFEGFDVADFDQVADFSPIGAGPYQFVSMLQTDLSTEVTLKRFERPKNLGNVKLERIVFRVFPDYSSLLSDIGNIDGVRLVPRNSDGEPILPKGFKAIPYTLPQYTALFFNLDRPINKDTALRLGLQLATNKQEIVDALHENKIVDTPLLEINVSDWRYRFDPTVAQGALYKSEWNLPERVRLRKLLSEREINATGFIKLNQSTVLLETGATLTLTGSTSDIDFPMYINGVAAQTGTVKRQSGPQTIWRVRLGTAAGSGGLRVGENIVKMTNKDNRTLDSAYVFRAATRNVYDRLQQEKQFIDSYIAGGGDDKLTIKDLFLDDGYLRKRKDNDPILTRVNDRGEPLKFKLLTSSSPPQYPVIAELIKKEWRAIGVDVVIDIPPTTEEFQERMLRRDYDILLFGQSLLDNLDSYPYWHASNVQDTTGGKSTLKLDAFNLSQYRSLEADALLATIREASDEQARQRALTKLNAIIKRDTPAIFLYSPLYVYGYREKISGIDLGKLSVHSDRFLTLNNWFIHTERTFKDGKGWLSFFPWIFGLM